MQHCDNCGHALDPALIIYTDDLPQRLPVCGLSCHVMTALKFMPRRTRCAEDTIPVSEFTQSLLCYEKLDEFDV